MELAGKNVVVTGGGSGIGRAMSTRFAAEGAAVTVADLDATGAGETVATINQGGGRARAQATDVADEAQVKALVTGAEEAYGPIDLFCSNAGVGVGGGPEAPDADWALAWDVNVMAHVYAARAVLPGMTARGEGYLLQTASAAGLLTNIGAAPYSVTKHAAVAFAEWVAITYGDQGVKVSCLCPQGVRTPMLLGGIGASAGDAVLAAGGMLEPADVAEAVVQGLRTEEFLILPHPEVRTYLQQKVSDYDRWLRGMRKLQNRLRAGG